MFWKTMDILEYVTDKINTNNSIIFKTISKFLITHKMKENFSVILMIYK